MPALEITALLIQKEEQWENTEVHCQALITTIKSVYILVFWMCAHSGSSHDVQILEQRAQVKQSLRSSKTIQYMVVLNPARLPFINTSKHITSVEAKQPGTETDFL